MVDLTSTYLRPRLEWCKRNHLAIEASIHTSLPPELSRVYPSMAVYLVAGCVGLASIDTLVVVVKVPVYSMLLEVGSVSSSME